nr:hypothetical protein [uncultured Marvinbryantia sp.]
MAVKTKAAEAAEKATTAAGNNEAENSTAEAGKGQETANNGLVEDVVKLVYIGPTLPAGKLKCNRIFEGTEAAIKKELEAVIKEYPLVERMLVNVEGLTEKKARVRTTGTIMNKYYSDILSAIAAKEQEV